MKRWSARAQPVEPVVRPRRVHPRRRVLLAGRQHHLAGLEQLGARGPTTRRAAARPTTTRRRSRPGGCPTPRRGGTRTPACRRPAAAARRGRCARAASGAARCPGRTPAAADAARGTSGPVRSSTSAATVGTGRMHASSASLNGSSPSFRSTCRSRSTPDAVELVLRHNKGGLTPLCYYRSRLCTTEGSTPHGVRGGLASPRRADWGERERPGRRRSARGAGGVQRRRQGSRGRRASAAPQWTTWPRSSRTSETPPPAGAPSGHGLRRAPDGQRVAGVRVKAVQAREVDGELDLAASPAAACRPRWP